MVELDLMQPFGIEIDLETGRMLRPERTSVRRASDMRGYYADEAALERLIRDTGDPVHYQVSEKPVPETPGNLMYCISTLQPGLEGVQPPRDEVESFAAKAREVIAAASCQHSLEPEPQWRTT